MESFTGGTGVDGGGGTGGKSEVAMSVDLYAVNGCDQLDSTPPGPVARSRANTWHGRPKVTAKDENGPEAAGLDGEFGPEGGAGDVPNLVGSAGAWRKGTTRRNAWGNLSYADLITKAIESSAEKRMTLSQIYAWMVQNITFFKDKGDSNSSAGWKNSIRHNLSLHNRFVRVQNEGTGKSSWWMINPDAKSVKVPRRRAATMDTKTYSGKRSRIQRAVSLNNSSSSSDLIGKNEECSQSTESVVFGTREFVGGSSLSGMGMCGVERMQPVEESDDVSESNVVPTSSSSSWPSNYATNENFAETLSESLADIFVGNLSKGTLHIDEFQNSLSLTTPLTSPLTTPMASPLTTAAYQNALTHCTFVTRDCPIASPAATSPGINFVTRNDFSGKFNAVCNDSRPFGSMAFGSGSATGFRHPSDASVRSVRTPMGVNSSSGVNVYANAAGQLVQMKALDDLHKANEGISNANYNHCEMVREVQVPGVAPLLNPRNLTPQFLLQLLASKPQLMAKMQHLIQARQQQQPESAVATVPLLVGASAAAASSSSRSGSMLQQLLTTTSSVTEISRSNPYQTSQMLSVPNEVAPVVSNSTAVTTFIPADLDLNFLDVDAADIDCDIDQVITHELRLGENLDFSFDQSTDG